MLSLENRVNVKVRLLPLFSGSYYYYKLSTSNEVQNEAEWLCSKIDIFQFPEKNIRNPGIFQDGKGCGTESELDNRVDPTNDSWTRVSETKSFTATVHHIWSSDHVLNGSIRAWGPMSERRKDKGTLRPQKEETPICWICATFSPKKSLYFQNSLRQQIRKNGVMA